MRKLVLALLVAAGCGGSGDDGPCQGRSGLYRISYSAQGGNCGPIPDSVVNSEGASTSTAMCMGGAMNSGNLCEVTVDTTCPIAGQPGTATARGKVTWTMDGQHGSGTMYFELRDDRGALECAGTYAVVYSRL